MPPPIPRNLASGYIREVGNISSFQRRECDVFYWKIDGFSTVSASASGNGYYCSPNFINLRYVKCRSYLRFYPHGARNQSGFIGLTFLSPEHTESSCVHLTLGLKTLSGRIEVWFSSYIILPEKNEFGSTTVIRQSEFLKRIEELAPSDCVTFVAFLSPDALKIIRDVVDRAEISPVQENDEEKQEKKGNEKVAHDMGKLLASGDRSDATILVDEAEYKVHSCILAARTPVFAALFEHETVEKATRKITITDCEPAIFKEFLNFIYTGSVQDLTAKNSLGLYRVADKYLVKELKEVCRENIQDNLCSETFCDVVQLALRCNDEDLLESAFDYCVRNFRLIIRSVEWQRYIKENPIEANEILIRSFGPP